jgi:hypothetical protein
MKAFLMFRDGDFDPDLVLPPNADDLMKDLALSVLFAAMAGEDEFLRDVGIKAVLGSLGTPEEIAYRQQVLIDCTANPDAARGMYDLVVEGIVNEKRIWGWSSVDYPMSTLHRSIEVLELFAGLLKRLRRMADERGPAFRSDGFRRLFAMLAAELDETYLQTISDHLQRLKLRGGILMSARLGAGNAGTDYILRKPPNLREGWIARFQDWMAQLGQKGEPSYSYEIADRDEAGANALGELRNRGISGVAAALAQSTEHILSFFRMLRAELAFYIGCLNLRDSLMRKGEPVCIPEPLPKGQPTCFSRALYDPCLSLITEGRVIGNDVSAEGKSLVMITGPNRGGKSTLLRSLGLAQLMMQCGMFVAGESFRANVSRGVFTHFKREEDTSMKSGKLDEEIGRMSAIVDLLTPGCLVLLNESFASTNEREGSEIAKQIVRALLEMGIKVVYVTHMFDLAHGFYAEHLETALFLRAERLSDGERTFRLTEGEPLPTSYGEDLYRVVFGQPSEAASPAPQPAMVADAGDA